MGSRQTSSVQLSDICSRYSEFLIAPFREMEGIAWYQLATCVFPSLLGMSACVDLQVVECTAHFPALICIYTAGQALSYYDQSSPPHTT